MGKEQISDIGDQITKNGKGDNSTTIELGATDAKKYCILKEEYSLHKRMVKKNMHKALSPISAISGYLELMKMLLEKKDNSESLERYCSKIEEGVSEISDIVEDLYSTFDDMREENNDTSVQSKSMISNEN